VSIDPRMVKDVLVSREVDSLRQLGREVNVRGVEAGVMEVMARGYAKKREAKRLAKVARKAPQKHRDDPAAEMAAAEGMRLVRAPARTGTSLLMSLEPTLGPSPKCRKRIDEIIRRAKLGETRFQPMWDLLVYSSTRLQTGVGYVFHLGPADRWRVFTAECESICDSTTGMIGEWR
jgi:hypothetical protein